MSKLNFDGRVAIITGAGGGLGRSYAVLLASRGCKIVVNDLGGSKQGEGKSISAADKVVAEIKQVGGEAVPDYHDVVAEGSLVVQTALDTWGRVDIVINNAGILRDKTFAKMTDLEFTKVLQVHVLGAHRVTHAAWPHMLKQNYGRIIMTGSAAGMYGNYGQTNYGAAKYALAGMALSLAREGARKNVFVNYISPLAASRLTESLLPKEMLGLLETDRVANVVGWLCHEECKENGGMFEIGGGYVSRVFYERSKGLLLNKNDLSPERIADRWNDVMCFSGGKVEYPENITDVDWVGMAEQCTHNKLVSTAESRHTFQTMKSSLSGRVAIITGAGGGLGRAYALLLGRYGCRVVVNDVSPPLESSNGRRPAEKVVDEIRTAGGIAMANYGDITTDAEKIVESVLMQYGGVDILVNNAGILRDKSYIKMADAEFVKVLDVHLQGSSRMIRAALPSMMKNKFGRIIMTTSAVGLYGNFGQVNYSTAKAGILGLSRSLSLEFGKLAETMDIRINTIAPNAGTAMTATVLPDEIVRLLEPELVAPLVVLLSSAGCPTQGALLEVGSGWAASSRFARMPWISCKSIDVAPKSFKALEKSERKELEYPAQAVDSLQSLVKASQKGEGAAKEGTMLYSYTPKDVVLYHMGLGLSDLKHTYEHDDQFEMLASFGVIPAMTALFPSEGQNDNNSPNDLKDTWMDLLPSRFNPMMLLHGEQSLEVYRQPPTRGTLRNKVTIGSVIPKEKGTVLTLIVDSFENSDLLFKNTVTLFLRGLILTADELSRFQKNSTQGVSTAPTGDKINWDSATALQIKRVTTENQAKLYRLSGDHNPLHIDSRVATAAGFRKPILHGLCTFGMTCEALQELTDTKCSRLASRFTREVYPGEELTIEAVKQSPTKYQIRARVGDRIVLDNGVYESMSKNNAEENSKVAFKTATVSTSPGTKGGTFEEIRQVLEDAWKKLSVAEQAAIKQKTKATIAFTTQKDTNHLLVFHFKESPEFAAISDCSAVALKKSLGGKGSDLTISLSDEALLKSFLLEGSPDPQSAFMKGQLKIVSGNMNLAMSLQPLLKKLRAS